MKPILETNCVRCHNPKGTDFEEGKTDVDLSNKAAAFDVVSTIVPGKPEKSKIYTTDHPARRREEGDAAAQQGHQCPAAPLEGADRDDPELDHGWRALARRHPSSSPARPRPRARGAAGGETALVNEIHERIVTSAAP